MKRHELRIDYICDGTYKDWFNCWLLSELQQVEAGIYRNFIRSMFKECEAIYIPWEERIEGLSNIHAWKAFFDTPGGREFDEKFPEEMMRMVLNYPGDDYMDAADRWSSRYCNKILFQQLKDREN